jgi:hypothetical protein
MIIPYAVDPGGSAYVDSDLYAGLIRAELKNAELAFKRESAAAIEKAQSESAEALMEERRAKAEIGRRLDKNIESFGRDYDRLKMKFDRMVTAYKDCYQQLQTCKFNLAQCERGVGVHGHHGQAQEYIKRIALLEAEMFIWRSLFDGKL